MAVAREAELAAMRRAIARSRDALGTTNPNPCVGAVVLDRAGRIVGEGVTQPAGGDHAEIQALQAAGDRARGATIVATLEPCRHHGRTGPCTAAIAAAGVSRVVYAVADPNGPAAGGAEALRAAGLEVEGGVLVDAARAVLGLWLVGAGRNRPHLTWKYAATLDGRTAAADGTSQWITGPAARRDVHRERLLADAVLVGIGTVLADDAQLTVRDWPATRQPLRVVVDTDARTPLGARVLDAAAPSLVAVATDADAHRVAALQAAGAAVISLPRGEGGLDLGALLTALRQREVFAAMLEGGATLAGSFVRLGLVDRVVGYHAPLLLGSGAPLLGDLGVKTLAGSARLTVDDVTAIGEDVRIVAHLSEGES